MQVFQSTSLLRGTTPRTLLSCISVIFQSTSLLRGTTWHKEDAFCLVEISIHVPLARDDIYRPCAPLLATDFNPRPSCEGRLQAPAPACLLIIISIHVPLARDDTALHVHKQRRVHFNPRPSCEGRPLPSAAVRAPHQFQSTSLLRGTTSLYSRAIFSSIYFNPRPSCEGRRNRRQNAHGEGAFQSTSLLRGTTENDAVSRKVVLFQSTSLLRGTTVLYTYVKS